MEKVFTSEIYWCRPLFRKDNSDFLHARTSEFIEELVSTKVYMFSDRGITLEDVHSFVCQRLRDFRELYPTGNFRVCTRAGKNKVIRSSYLSL